MIYMIAGFMVVMAFWKKDNILFIFSAIITILAGAELISNYPGNNYAGVSVMLMGFGVFQLVTAIIMTLTSGGPSKGWSQFSGWYNAVRGKS